MYLRTDEAIHQAMTGLSWCKFNEYEKHPDYEWYYAEERNYVIRIKRRRMYFMIKARNPDEALDAFLIECGIE